MNGKVNGLPEFSFWHAVSKLAYVLYGSITGDKSAFLVSLSVHMSVGTVTNGSLFSV